NTFFNISAYGIHYYPGTNNGVIIRNNTFHDNGKDGPGTDLILYGSNHQIYNNVFYNTPYGGIQTSSGSSGDQIYHNTVYNAGNIGNGQGVQAGIYVGGSSHTLNNNLVIGSANGIINAGSGITIATNITGGSASSIFTDVSSGDFTLKPGS